MARTMSLLPSAAAALLLLMMWVLVPTAADRCPGDEQLACPEPSVCCRSDSEKQPFICCPYKNGVCCADGRHCCREGFTCDLKTNRCVKKAPQPGLCPDGKSSCPPDATCCPMSGHRWGCCPYQNAVCCSDKIHCCPQGTQCDLAKLSCVLSSAHPMLQLAGNKMEDTKGHFGLEA